MKKRIQTRMHSSRMPSRGSAFWGGSAFPWHCGNADPPCEQTDACENITLPTLRMRAVNTRYTCNENEYMSQVMFWLFYDLFYSWKCNKLTRIQSDRFLLTLAWRTGYQMWFSSLTGAQCCCWFGNFCPQAAWSFSKPRITYWEIHFQMR